MATNYTNTLAGMLLLNDQNMKDIYPNGVLDDAPVIERAYAIPASQGGTVHKYLRRSGAAGAAFRALNTGVSNAAETFDDITCTCKILDASFARDCMLADAYRKGRSEYIKKETNAALRAAFCVLEKAIFNTGVSNSFEGLNNMEDFTDLDSTQVVNGGGTTGASVWLLRWAEDGVALVAGNDGKISMLWNDDNPTMCRVASSGGWLSAYLVTLAGYFGLQVGSKYDVARICNLDSTSGKTVSDIWIAKGIAKFPAARQPNMIVMNRTGLSELQQSRTATNPTGAPAPFPTEAFGIPIVVTDTISNDETTVDTTTTVTTGTSTSTTTNP